MTEHPTRQCTICKEILPWGKFRIRNAKPRSHCRECEAAKAREYREANPEIVKSTKRATYMRHQERYVHENRERHARNIERDRELCRRWAKDNPEKNRMRGHRRRARLKGNGGNLTVQEWQAIKLAHNNTCAICGCHDSERPMTIDHIRPIAAGGTHSADNVQPLCKPCNSRKKDKYKDPDAQAAIAA